MFEEEADEGEGSAGYCFLWRRCVFGGNDLTGRAGLTDWISADLPERFFEMAARVSLTRQADTSHSLIETPGWIGPAEMRPAHRRRDVVTGTFMTILCHVVNRVTLTWPPYSPWAGPPVRLAGRQGPGKLSSAVDQPRSRGRSTGLVGRRVQVQRRVQGYVLSRRSGCGGHGVGQRARVGGESGCGVPHHLDSR
jgi:hypothetical protein